MKVVIVGGGAAGLAIGWRLAQAGCVVDIVERGLAGRGSTWAAAGMLAATAETHGEDDVHARFARHARTLWPDFARDLEEASDTGIGFRLSGSLLIPSDHAHAQQLAARVRQLHERGEAAEWLDSENLRHREPRLTNAVAGALFAPDDAQVDNRVLGEALATAFTRAEGVLRERCEAKSLFLVDNRVRGLVTSDGLLPADYVILAAGAWSSVLGAQQGLPPVRPAKGQMTALVPPPGEALPYSLIWGEGVYLVPREDSLLVGATVEDTGFETSVSREARDRLIAGAVRLMPSLAEWPCSESWAGLRPRTPDSLPVLGETGIGGLFIASGQFRNGILFAPAIADLLRRAVFGGAADPMMRAFDPKRFQHAS